MPIKLTKNIEQFDSLELRMRIMLTVATIFVIFMLFDMAIFTPNDEKIKSTQSSIENNNNQIEDLLNAQDELNQNITKKRRDPRNRKLQLLNEQLNAIHEKLTKHTINLVQPEDMADVIKVILVSSKSLELQKLNKHTTVELSPINKHQTNTDDEIKLYRHSMQIVLKGNYLATIHFLQKLEKMKKPVAFDSINYLVESHPKAIITLTVSTLSLHKEWVGG